jgi:hypothetical protein
MSICKEFDLFEKSAYIHHYTTTPIAIYLSLLPPFLPPTRSSYPQQKHTTEQKPQNKNHKTQRSHKHNTKAIRKPQSNPRNETSQPNREEKSQKNKENAKTPR